MTHYMFTCCTLKVQSRQLRPGCFFEAPFWGNSHPKETSEPMEIPCTPQSHVLSLLGKCTRSGWPLSVWAQPGHFPCLRRKSKETHGRLTVDTAFQGFMLRAASLESFGVGGSVKTFECPGTLFNMKLLDSVQGISCCKFNTSKFN